MRNIVVPTDFSFTSYSALDLAKKMATKSAAAIHLIHVIEHNTDTYSHLHDGVEIGASISVDGHLHSRIETELEALKNAHSDPHYRILTKVLTGNAFRELKKYIDRHEPDLVIMGARGVTNAEEFFLGSLTEKVIRSISCPVITVKGKVGDNEFKNIVYATDLQEDNALLVAKVNELQLLFDAQLHIVKINTRKKFTNDIDTMVLLRRLADKYQLKNYTLSSYSHEDEEYGVVYFADEKNADLIVMGVHESTGLRRLISGGSLADEVIDHTFRPILTHRFQTQHNE